MNRVFEDDIVFIFHWDVYSYILIILWYSFILGIYSYISREWVYFLTCKLVLASCLLSAPSQAIYAHSQCAAKVAFPRQINQSITLPYQRHWGTPLCVSLPPKPLSPNSRCVCCWFNLYPLFAYFRCSPPRSENNDYVIVVFYRKAMSASWGHRMYFEAGLPKTMNDLCA